ncbi:e3 ubiquitin-protein ligase [Gigaspora margarita]|uniref:E3 ubiquitin-protein ligase n=1 Tax=Gigaspora margarita TaxID=4874 RepID=A0A8H4AIT7_GIGMA|nr:e3 ubiquitin-protein ligase [Gigaspora margarita]
MLQNPDSICALYCKKDKVPDNVKEFLKERLECLAHQTMYPLDLPLYALLANNIIKIALKLLRVRANVHVVVMGETGCGKSNLIGFLTKVVEVNYKPFNLHAGITEQRYIRFHGLF